MAIPELSALSRRQISASAVTLLFERLPDRIFAPLASPNRHRYWALLCMLHSRRFGPDAPLPPSNGFYVRDIAADIEEALQTEEEWEEEADEAPDSPTNTHASGILNWLIDAGWFCVERRVFDKRVTMRPAVSQFLTRLVTFAETGPVFVAGKIRSIDALLALVMSAEGGGESLAEAAEQARNLLEHVRNTGTNVRDLMESLSPEITTAQYVQRFFNDYIERVFIGDYRELRTRDHPLSKRPQILRRVEDIAGSDNHRARLISWYATKRCSGDAAKAEELFERDIYRLTELQRVDEYLDRLDDEIRRANKRALAFLDYRLRSLKPVDHLIAFAIQAVASDRRALAEAPFAPGELLSPKRLAEPRVVLERSAPSPLRQHIPSAQELAWARVMTRARDSRSVTPPKLAEFVRHQLGERTAMPSHELTLANVADVRAFQTLMIVSAATNARDRSLNLYGKSMVRGLQFKTDGESEMNGMLISGVPFLIQLGKQPTLSGE